jgi:hypothetical protein
MVYDDLDCINKGDWKSNQLETLDFEENNIKRFYELTSRTFISF